MSLLRFIFVFCSYIYIYIHSSETSLDTLIQWNELNIPEFSNTPTVFFSGMTPINVNKGKLILVGVIPLKTQGVVERSGVS